MRPTSDRLANIYLAASALVMTALIIIVVVLVIRVSSVAAANQANAVKACKLANVNRAENVRIFHGILGLPALASPQFITAPNVAKQRAAVAVINADIKAAYAPHDCVALYSTKR